MSAALGGLGVGWGGGDIPPLCQLAGPSRFWGPQGWGRHGDRAVPPGTAAVPSTGRLQMAVAGTMVGLCVGAARHGSARLGTALHASRWAPPRTAGVERGHDGVPLIPVGWRGSRAGWDGVVSSRSAAHRSSGCRGTRAPEEPAAGGVSEPLAPDGCGMVGPVGTASWGRKT